MAGVAVDVEEEGEDGGGPLPVGVESGAGHGEELSEGQGAGVAAEDSYSPKSGMRTAENQLAHSTLLAQTDSEFSRFLLRGVLVILVVSTVGYPKTLGLDGILNLDIFQCLLPIDVFLGKAMVGTNRCNLSRRIN